MNRYLVCKMEGIKFNNIKNNTKMFNFDDITKKGTKEQNPNWPEISGYPNRILMKNFDGSGFEKTNALLNLTNHEANVDKTYLYAKDPWKAKYQLLINKRETTDLKYLNDWKAFIEYSNDINVAYKNIEEHNPNKKGKLLVVFDHMIAGMLSRGRKLDISLVFITQFFFAVAKHFRLNSTHYFVMKILKRTTSTTRI